MTLDKDLCQARIATPRPDGSDECQRHARHEHTALATGDRYELCSQHFNALVRRERLGSSQHLIEIWTQA